MYKYTHAGMKRSTVESVYKNKHKTDFRQESIPIRKW